jgi:hypothetical protein
VGLVSGDYRVKVGLLNVNPDMVDEVSIQTSNYAPSTAAPTSR